MKKIESAITDYKVIKDSDPEANSSVHLKIVHMHESVPRPEVLLGSTYKVKTPMTEHAMYITINDIVLNEGSEHEIKRPFEIFINSKNMDNFQWVVALTRLISAVFRKGGDAAFMVEEMKAVFDPKGGYFKPGGLFMPSIVAEIGHVIERHMKMLGMLPANELSPQQQKFIAEKKQQLQSSQNDFPDTAAICNKCSTKAVVLLDNCMTCLNCGESKCG